MILKYSCPSPNDMIWGDEHQMRQSNLKDYHDLTIARTLEKAVDSNK